MPNWVYNNLSITDPSGKHTDDVSRLMEQVGATYTVRAASYASGTFEVGDVEVTDPGFSFWNIVRPEGEDSKEYAESVGASGAMPFWYDWNCENWGTKWDASDVNVQDHAADHKQITFSTPWSPPLPVLVTLSEQYPNLHIELEWEEEQGYGGTFVFTNGEATETDAYDIPNSHAEHAERDRECVCDWDDDPTNYYPDCPGYVPDTNRIPEDELEVEAML